ncbi:cadherin-related tumor suppressor-like [Agrilus planipennis]|uniref:Cadherin-related tumor suppressor-like n=1 Tax=Agrilus planipennis TaxID=224129 RepID=A0A7F5RA63_AGRPL|nr:cadherin-related tumor suppressor-like [Agrilus planipennis]
MYLLQVRITVLDKNDSPPSFKETSLKFSVSEDLSPGQPVSTISADDPDTIGTLEYTLLPGHEGHFSLNKSTGVLKLAEPLDRETKELYKLSVRASDGIQYTDAIITIQVTDTNDNTPVFSESAYSFDIPENAGRGSKVGQIKATDPDLGINAQVTYTVISDWANDIFSLNPQTGVFTLTARLDYEEVTDTNDNTPVFSESAYSFDIPENAGRGSKVGQIKATDPDLGINAQVTYTVISDWANDIFSLNPQTGVFTLTARLDYEEVQHYILVVQAQDAGHPPLSSTVTIYCNVLDLNDNAPLFDPMSYSNEIFENVSISTAVVTVSATDMDSGEL